MSHKMIDFEKTAILLESKFRENGMTNSAVSEEFGVSVSTVSYWLNGKKLPSLNHLVAIAGVLGCSINDLIATKD